MIQFPPDSSVLDDIEFIQKNYRDYFNYLRVVEKSAESVRFELSPVNDPKRSCEVLLNRQCYLILADTIPQSELIGHKCESIEQLLEEIMGGREFSDMLMKLTVEKLNSSC